MRQQTWFAVVACVLATVPGFFIGALLRMLLYVFGGWVQDSDFLYLHALFGLDAPNAVYRFIFSEAIPDGLQGITAGFFAVWVMEKVANGANYALAATITGALYAGFAACLIILTLATSGVTSAMVVSIIQTIGIWVGLASAASTLPAPARVPA